MVTKVVKWREYMKKIITVAFVLFSSVSAFAQLPQNHPWEVTLRNYMASLKTGDFDVPLKHLSWNPAWAASDEELYKWWLAFRDLPDDKEIQMDSRYFLLSSIQPGDGQIHMAIGRGKYSVLSAAFWAGFDYPGNPYYNSRAVKLRALIPAMVDMMMLTQYQEDGHKSFQRSDFAGANLIMYAYPFFVGQDVLPANVRAAYLEGMREMRAKIITWGPTGIFADMDSFALVGMWYMAKATGDPGDIAAAKAYTDRDIKRWFYNAGYMGHGDAFDATYNGLALYFYTWVGMISDYQPVIDVIRKMITLKSYLTVPDPDGYWNGPSHFSTATSGPVSSDQWNDYLRDVADGMVTDKALYLLEGNGVNRNYGWEIIPDKSYMESAAARLGIPGILIHGFSGYRRAAPAPFTSLLKSSYVPLIWKPDHNQHWINGNAQIFICDGYRDGFYKKIISLKKTNSPLLLSPWQRKAGFIKVFSNNTSHPDSCAFVVAKLGGYGAIIHTARLSNWGKATGSLSGLGGGALSTFWTPGTGTVINGIAAGYQNPDLHDTWGNWTQWGDNAISGVNGDGKPFSSARNRFPRAVARVSADSTQAVVIAEGQISSNTDGGRTAPNGAIQGKVHYRRTFELSPAGLTITSKLTSDGQDKAKELWEMIPVYLQNGGNQSGRTAVLFQVNGKAVPASTSLTRGVVAIQLRRFGGVVNITFEHPQSAKLSVPREINYQVHATTQNIMIDLLHSGGKAVPLPKQASVTYTIASSLAKIQDDGATPIEGSSGSNLPRKIELGQNYPNPFNPTTNIGFTLNKASVVTMQIFDILGRLVSMPVDNQALSAGEHSIIFNGSNLSSGVYIYRLTAGQNSYTKKMMIMK